MALVPAVAAAANVAWHRGSREVLGVARVARVAKEGGREAKEARAARVAASRDTPTLGLMSCSGVASRLWAEVGTGRNGGLAFAYMQTANLDARRRSGACSNRGPTGSWRASQSSS